MMIFSLSMDKFILLDDAVSTHTGLIPRLGMTFEDFIGMVVIANASVVALRRGALRALLLGKNPAMLDYRDVDVWL